MQHNRALSRQLPARLARAVNASPLRPPANRVTAIVAGNDTIALGALEAAKRQGIDVPAQLSIIGFDDMPLAGSPLVGLTSIQQPVEAMARIAARRMVERIHAGGLTPPVHDVLPIKLIRRNSTGHVANS
nr:substrate-binding domain-containing protein [Cupriavidus sp. SK-4]